MIGKAHRLGLKARPSPVKPNEKPAVLVSLLSSPTIMADGVVREVSPVADPTTRTYQVKVSLENPPPAMRFGASVLGRLKATTAPVIALPGSALYDKGGKPASKSAGFKSHGGGKDKPGRAAGTKSHKAEGKTFAAKPARAKPAPRPVDARDTSKRFTPPKK